VLLGVDTGGTFTDFVLLENGRMRVHKVLSTPREPERAIAQGVRELGLEAARLRIVHGSTVATNAVLEGKGARTLYIGNRGFGDLLTIGRQARAELYELRPSPQAPPVPPELCIETGGRLSADGRWLDPLSESDLARLRAEVACLKPESVAVNLLFSWLDDDAERRIREALPDDLFVSLSSEVLPEIREYERGIATWLNSWVGPLVAGYLGRLRERLRGARIAVMQSAATTIALEQAGAQAVRMLLSGPAGGLAGARWIGRQCGRERLLTFDMGGTSADVALIDGEPALTTRGRIGRYPVAVPMVDIHTIGAGGGSLARLDAGGMLRVGPESAGADPGPACYRRGGKEPTVTDANLVLGRLLPTAFLGGRMHLDPAAARAALEPLAQAMGMSLEQAARGIVRVADEHMARALRRISIERGADPATLTLVSFGGAGGLHVCALADALGVREAMAPVDAGVLSALGMLATPPGRALSHALQGRFEALDIAAIEAGFSRLAEQGREALLAEGQREESLMLEPSLDLRYLGQSATLEVPWRGRIDEVAVAFETGHEQRYGHRIDAPVELVNLRLRITGRAGEPALPALSARADAAPYTHSDTPDGAVPVYDREALAPGQIIAGPAMITETVATLWLAEGWCLRVDPLGNLLLRRNEDTWSSQDNRA